MGVRPKLLESPEIVAGFASDYAEHGRDLHGHTDFWEEAGEHVSRHDRTRLCPLCFLEGKLGRITSEASVCVDHFNAWRSFISEGPRKMAYIALRIAAAVKAYLEECEDEELMEQLLDMIAFGLRRKQ